MKRSVALDACLLILIFQDSEDELPECLDRSEVCSKVDLYGSPWVERQCRCPDGRTCPSSLHGDDGHTIVDKTRQYKLCEPVKRLPICRYFKLVAIVRLIESIYQVVERSNVPIRECFTCPLELLRACCAQDGRFLFTETSHGL